MAVSNYFQLQGFPQGEDMSKAHGIFVKLNAQGKLVKCQAAKDPVVGVVIIPLPFDEGDERNVPAICCERGTKVPAVISGAIAAGDSVALAADGKITKATEGSVAIGIATEAGTTDGQVITILFTGQFSL